MSFLTEWITNIIVFILLATVIDMLLPSSNMKKYAKIVTGLILITIILTPLLKLFTTDFDAALASMDWKQSTSQSVENSIELKKKEIQASQRAYILEQMAVQMKNDAEKEMMDRHNKVIASVSIQAEDLDRLPESITSVTVHLTEEKDDSVEAVQMVEIDSQDQKVSRKETEDNSGIASFLAEKWNLTQDQLIISVEGGNSSRESR